MGVDPVTIGFMAAGTGMQLYGSMQQAKGLRAAGSAAMRTAEFNAAIRKRNERVARQEADLRERVGDREAIRFRKNFRKLQDKADTAYRKGGVATGTGTPILVAMENANEAEEEVQLIGLQARTDAGRLREQGVNQRLAGEVALLEGRSRQQAFNTRAKTAMISGFSNALMGAGRISQIA
jgi:hypothetical protein|tara:strand:+ start:670 stop:1209 length:540 start_codon:yes stop_codon:yes gene_type:complete